MVVPLNHPPQSGPQQSPPQSGPYAGLTYRSAKRFIARQFAEADLPFAEDDARELLLGLTGLSPTDYALRGRDFASEAELASLQAAATRRLSGEPVDRILGWRDFYGRRFAIDHVLSPRGDTEVLLLAALAAIRNTSAPHLLDLGTGSGALAISVLCERPDATAIATDRDPAALTTADRNAAAHQLSDRMALIQSDWFDDVPATVFDAVLSNPPYITTDAMTALEREVSEHDPEGALHGGADGLDPYRVLIPGAVSYLKPGGWLGVEIGFDQRDAVQALFRSSGFTAIDCRVDPAGLDRVVSGRRSC